MKGGLTFWGLGEYNSFMRTLSEHNEGLQREAAPRWRLILELSETRTHAEIARELDITRSAVSKVVRKAKDYFGENGHAG